jgi:hypothetical protein
VVVNYALFPLEAESMDPILYQAQLNIITKNSIHLSEVVENPKNLYQAILDFPLHYS